ncbi:MAG: hypothetical protein RR495_07080 [Anaerovoracaceae bacterium]
MKTVIVSLSPRKKFSASMYYSKVLKFFINEGEVSIINLKTESQYNELKNQLHEIDNLVIVTPVYVDTIPSTALEILVKIENFVKDKDIRLNVYGMTNCGFYEGEQNELAQRTIRLWSDKCGFVYKGGIGIGAGVMVAFTRILPIVGIVLELLTLSILMVIGAIKGELQINDVFDNYFPYNLLIQTALYLMWNMGLFINGYKLAKNIESLGESPLKYTTIWFCPRALFVIIASIYWVIASAIWYRGKFWRLHKMPKKKLIK